MANFPDEDLELTFELALGADVTTDPGTWAWTDFTSRLVPDGLITISRGIAVGSSNSATTFGTLTCLNEDGALTPLLETSPNWPYIDVGTPARLRARPLGTLTDTFTRTATQTWGSGNGFTWTPVTGINAFNVGGSSATMSHASVNFVRLIRSDQFRADLDVVFDASVPAVATGGSLPIGPTLREQANGDMLWVTLEFGVSGATAITVWKRAGNTTGVYTGLGTTSIPALTYTAGQVVRCRTRLVDDHLQVRAWLASGSEPVTWAVDMTVAHLEPGLVGMASWAAATNTNTLPVVFTVDNVTISNSFFPRLEGYIADVRPTFLPVTGGTTWSQVQIDVAGIGSLAEKLDAIAESPMRRSVRTQVPTPVAYWSLEDAESSLSAASVFPGQPPMTVSGPAVFSFDQGTPTLDYLSRFGTLPLVSLAAGASLQATFTPSSVATEWAVALVAEFYAPEVPAITELRIAEWRTPAGTHNRWALVAPVAGGYKVRAYNDALGTSTDVVTYGTAFVGQGTWVIEAHQNGGNVDVELFVNDVSLVTGSVASTLAAPDQVIANPDKANTTNSLTPFGLKFIVGHIRVRDEITAIDTPRYTVPETGQTVTAINAWYLEPAHRRVKRLCDEELVPFRLVGAPTVAGSTLLNAQQPGSFTTLTAAAADAESGGLLYEKRFGYYYLPRSIRYTPAVALTIDMSIYAYSQGADPGQVLAPKLDARGANYWTVQRTNGSSGSAAADTAFRKRRGTITGGATLDVLTDDVLDDHAAWRKHLNVDAQDANYPAIPIDLAANPALLPAWLACDIGARVQRTNQPTIAGVGTVDQIVEGYTEKLGPRTWDVSANATPAKVWDVARYDDTSKRKDSRTSTLNAGYSTTALTMVVTFTDLRDAWSTTSLPYDWRVNGERIRVTAMGAVTGSGPYTQSATVTRSINGVVRLHLVGEEVHMHPDQLARYAL